MKHIRCIQILTIPTVDFILWTATSSSASPSVPHDLNVYPVVPDDGFRRAIMGNRNRLKSALECFCRDVFSANFSCWCPTLPPLTHS